MCSPRGRASPSARSQPWLAELLLSPSDLIQGVFQLHAWIVGLEAPSAFVFVDRLLSRRLGVVDPQPILQVHSLENLLLLWEMLPSAAL